MENPKLQSTRGQRISDRRDTAALLDRVGRLTLQRIIHMDKCKCGGEGWLCEQHPDRVWPHESASESDGQCAGPGMPCTCNPKGHIHKDFTVIWTAKDGYAN